jgi:hypothetical protein
LGAAAFVGVTSVHVVESLTGVTVAGVELNVQVRIGPV